LAKCRRAGGRPLRTGDAVRTGTQATAVAWHFR